jgi:hypothetical protein
MWCLDAVAAPDGMEDAAEFSVHTTTHQRGH